MKISSIQKVIYLIFSAAILFGCAKMVAPTGGPKDEEHPLIVESDPRGSTICEGDVRGMTGIVRCVDRFERHSSDRYVVAVLQSDVWSEFRAGPVPVNRDAETIGKRIGKWGMV